MNAVQFKPFASFWPDPEASAIDSFTFSWSTEKFYAFPPPSAIIPHFLQKISSDNATGLLIVPNLPHSPWYSLYNRMLISERIIIPSSKHLILLPNHRQAVHPLHKTLQLLAAMISGTKDYQ